MLLGILFFPSIRFFTIDDGSLQLDTDVIINSDGDIGTTSDFSIRSQLFTPTYMMTHFINLKYKRGGKYG